ncbi:hypothetical protein A5710_04070 [Mycolicibacter sinensis]|uniref:Uncharacterized protein n=1 Tax=Mycolicibacter sinensis (strain JDM601) TaxID=875328 RepID=A0A1A2XSP5_MYCSD|nr:hypothetical protein A5710_04070 [Mycolicibacter sinensis]
MGSSDPPLADVEHGASAADIDGLLGRVPVTVCRCVVQPDVIPAGRTGQPRDAGQHRGQQLDGTAVPGGVSAGPAGCLGGHWATA